MIQVFNSGQALRTARLISSHILLRSRSSLRPFKSPFVTVQLDSFSESSSQHFFKTLSNWTVGSVGSTGCRHTTVGSVPCMGGGTRLRDGSRGLGVFGKISGRLPGKGGRGWSVIPFFQ